MKTIEKKLYWTIHSLENFFKENFYEVQFPHESVNKAVAKTIKKDKGLYFEFAKMSLTSQVDSRNLFDNEEDRIQFLDSHKNLTFDIRTCSSLNIAMGLTSAYTSVNGVIEELITDKLNKFQTGFYRAVILSNEDFLISGHFHCENQLKVDDTSYGSGVLEITINEMKLHLYSYLDKISKRKLFFIETQSKSVYENFVSILDEIVLAITYLTGIFLGQEIYILGSEDDTFEQNNVLSLKKFFDDLKNGKSAIPDLNLQHEMKVPIKMFETKYLESLISELGKSLLYKRTILLICQAHSEPNYVKSTLYSVALETITNMIAENIEDKIKPIPDKTLAKNVRKDLTQTLSKFKSLLTQEAFKKIETDIERINSPTNKQKLLAPFEYFKIKLPAKDIDAIEKRNDFLHGRIPETTDKHYLAITNNRLLFCINCLVLKQIDFKGYIMYHPVLYQYGNKIEMEEYPIRII